MTSGVTFDAAGRTHCLRYGMNALVRYQQAAGESMQAAVARLQERPDDPDVVVVRRMFWAGLEGVSEDEAGDIMDAVGLARASEIMGAAVAAAFGGAGNATGGRAS